MNFKEYMKTGTFEEYLEEQYRRRMLTEAPIAEEGDFHWSLMTSSISNIGYENHWIKKGVIKSEIGELEVLKNKGTETRIAGKLFKVYDEAYKRLELRFMVFGEITLNKRKICNKEYYAVEMIETKKDLRNRNIATLLYKFLVQTEKLSLISDDTQYFGARKLWARLSHTLKVDVINTETCEVKENIILKHGDKSEEYDEKYWSSEFDSSSKQKIRFILRDIKI